METLILKQQLRDLLTKTLFEENRATLTAALAEIERLETENERLHKEIERLLALEQQLWGKQGEKPSGKRRPSPEDYPPGWVTGETP